MSYPPPTDLQYVSPLFIRSLSLCAPPLLFACSLGPQWAGFVSLAGAVVLPVEAWANVTEIEVFDAGNSKTNSLYWIATRPQGGNYRRKKRCDICLLRFCFRLLVPVQLV